MPDRFLTRQGIAEAMDTGPGVAERLLASQGVFPINLGVGKGRGPRWLESAVINAMRNMHDAVQQAHAPRARRKHVVPSSGLENMSAGELYTLTRRAAVQ